MYGVTYVYTSCLSSTCVFIPGWHHLSPITFKLHVYFFVLVVHGVAVYSKVWGVGGEEALGEALEAREKQREYTAAQIHQARQVRYGRCPGLRRSHHRQGVSANQKSEIRGNSSDRPGEVRALSCALLSRALARRCLAKLRCSLWHTMEMFCLILLALVPQKSEE